MPRPKKPTAPELARQLHAAEPGLSPSEIAARVSAQLRRPIKLSQIKSALASSGKRGRPRRGEGGERVQLWINAHVVARARALAAARGLTLSRWTEWAMLAMGGGKP